LKSLKLNRQDDFVALGSKKCVEVKREQMIFENDKVILAELSFRRRKVIENLEKNPSD
jgi:hypothetical protein